MAFLINRVADTDPVDLIAGADQDTSFGDNTKLTCEIQSVVICATSAAVSYTHLTLPTNREV